MWFCPDLFALGRPWSNPKAGFRAICAGGQPLCPVSNYLRLLPPIPSASTLSAKAHFLLYAASITAGHLPPLEH